MNKGKSYIRIISIIYVAAIILTVFSFIGLGFSESLFRFLTSLVAVLLAESVVYGYCIFWLRTAGSVQRTSPVLLSGAFITGIYAAGVFASAIVFDWLLELSPLWYAAVQLLILLMGGITLAVIGIYGWNAGSEEQQRQRSMQAFRQHQSEINEISALASSWKNPETEQLIKVLNNLRDQFKFSDPISDPSLYATEDIMNQQIALLHDHVKLLLMTNEPHENWQAEINEMADSIKATLERRNRELAALK
ncbi:hypothetical protein MHB77_14215 [Paenibacillus sp. FSL K6-3166]|uniref:hypothetical protein n=1 Tax=unclassified Paenibacillus TaxID=185978 RepID=UPI000BA117CB|nr:hypothetical protein [Paenibacillus sp. VTT E-133291]OZQ77517.1 hypothetical protein CA598_29780 [Paenibacillus sp. VTT E-133291]